MEKIVRKNTLEYKFDRSKERPSPIEVYEWLSGDLGIKVDQVLAVQLDSVQNAVYVKFIDEQTLEASLNRNGTQLSMRSKNEVIGVSVKKCDENRKIVRVMHLPVEVDNRHLQESLSPFGKIEDIE